MKTILALFAFLVVSTLHATPYDESRLAHAIAQRETGAAWDGTPGKAGELSDWQITFGVWSKHMPGIPFAMARQPEQARVCVRKHLRWLAEGLRLHGIEPTPARIATAWNIGRAGTIRRQGRITAYGREVANLYYAP